MNCKRRSLSKGLFFVSHFNSLLVDIYIPEDVYSPVAIYMYVRTFLKIRIWIKISRKNRIANEGLSSLCVDLMDSILIHGTLFCFFPPLKKLKRFSISNFFSLSITGQRYMIYQNAHLTHQNWYQMSFTCSLFYIYQKFGHVHYFYLIQQNNSNLNHQIVSFSNVVA
jgi:hypothetical protein